MASKHWLKLYYEILDDPKMGRLSSRLYRRTIECFLLAGELDEGGFLPPIGTMAWRVRETDEMLESDLIELQKTGILTTIEGRWFIPGFADRQRAATGAERTERWREKKRTEEYYGDEEVTKRHTDKIR